MQTVNNMEDITNQPPKRKYAKDNPEAVKRRNSARTERKPGGTINFTADTKEEVEQIQALFNRVKSFLGEGKSRTVSSKATLEEVLQFFITRNVESVADRDENTPQADNGDFTDCSYSRVRTLPPANNNCLFVRSHQWTSC